MQFATPLVPATLIRRYKRFLADVRLTDDTEAVAHCPNPGAMQGLAEPGTPIWLERNDDPRKKLRWGWRLSVPAGTCVGIDTGAANRVVAEALGHAAVPQLAGYADTRAEVAYGNGSRVDFRLSGPERRDCYVEVKSVTLCREPGLAEFPDSVTARGARHLAELSDMVAAGHRAVLLYLVQRADCTGVAVAGDIDPAYAAALEGAKAAGVEVLAHACRIDPEGIVLAGAIQVDPRARPRANP
jgi:sugar fermentation stimulation protein A